MKILNILLILGAVSLFSGCATTSPNQAASSQASTIISNKPVDQQCNKWCHNGWCTNHCDEVVPTSA